MASVEDLLWQKVKEIEPSRARKDGAQRSHRFFRDVLRTGQFASRVVDDYLSGSYARGTAIAPLDDVDIIFVIDPARFHSGISRALGFKPDPAKVLDSFHSAIKYRYPDSSVVGQRRSIGLRMHHLHIDVVPAIADSTKRNHIWIPDRNENAWLITGPKIHSICATELNKTTKNRFKPLVKLLKYWNQGLPSTAQIRSFTIETMAVRLFSNHRLESLEEGLLMFFDFVVWLNDERPRLKWRDRCDMSFSWGSMNVPDVAQTGSNVAAKVSSAKRSRFAEKARISRDRVVNALEASTMISAWSRMLHALRV